MAIERTTEDVQQFNDQMRRIEEWAARKVQAEAAGSTDVWPAGWSSERIADHREIGRKHLAANKA